MKFLRQALYFFLLCSCIDRYDVTSEYHESIVVQGLITDQPGPYLVDISKTFPISGYEEGFNSRVSGATVSISDDDGNTENLVEKSAGKYYTTSLQGVVGKTYTLKVTTADGISFQSSAEKMLPVGDFTILSPQLQINEPPSQSTRSTNGFKISVSSDVLPEQQNRVWWRAIGTYEILTFPQLQEGPCGACLLEPNPYQCSGYIQTGKYFCKGNFATPCYTSTLQIKECTCCSCWVSQYSTSPLISDTRFVSNGKIDNQYIFFIEANRRTFYKKYYLEIQQLSITPTMYEFLKKIKIQESNSSNLFQVPPPKTTGNVTSSEISVIGYFTASAMKSHAISFTKDDLPYYLPPIDTVWLRCYEAGFYPNSTNVKPAFW